MGKKILIGIVAFIIGVPLILFGYIYLKLNDMYDKEEAKKIEQTIKPVEATDGITNILLIGVDGTNLEKGNRSDSMIVLTIDSKNKNMRLTSLARDTLVNIPKYGEEKLTHAYAYGGPSLLIETINKNFELKIDKYAAVNFESFEKIIDLIGGVEIDVLPKEVEYIPGLKSSGKQVLNGKEALAYSRIRYADNAYERDQRQRNVIESAYSKLSKTSSGNLIEIGNNIISYTKTNIPPMEVLKLATNVLKLNSTNFEQLEFPIEGYREGKNIEGKGWVITWDKQYNNEQLNKFIYDYNLYINSKDK